MDTKAISKAAKKLNVAEARLVRVVENKNAYLEKAGLKYTKKVADAGQAVQVAKAALTSLVSAA